MVPTSTISAPIIATSTSVVNFIQTEPISSQDLFDISQNIAQVNLGYLGISVAILGLLGGIFVIFNFKPLKESLTKQEREIAELKKEAFNLIELSKEQTEEIISNFEASQTQSLQTAFTDQEQKIKLENRSRLQKLEKNLTEKIYSVSESNDQAIKEITIAEATNIVSEMEKTLTKNLTELDKRIVSLNSQYISMKVKLSQIDELTQELEAYKYDKEGKMGGILITTDLLKTAIDEYLNYDKETRDVVSWKVTKRINALIEYTRDYIIKDDYKKRIREQLARISDERKFEELVKKLEEKITDTSEGNV